MKGRLFLAKQGIRQFEIPLKGIKLAGKDNLGGVYDIITLHWKQGKKKYQWKVYSCLNEQVLKVKKARKKNKQIRAG